MSYGAAAKRTAGSGLLAILTAIIATALSPIAQAGASGGCDEAISPAEVGGGDGLETELLSYAPGANVCLRAGSFNFRETIVRVPRLTIRSFPGERAHLNGRLVINPEADGTTVENLDLDGRSAELPDSVSPMIAADDVTFRGNDVTNERTNICFVIGSHSTGIVHDAHIEANRIHDCGELPANNFEHGIYVEASDHAVIRDNWVYRNAGRGIQLYPDANHTRITGNVITENGEGVAFGGDGVTSARNTLVTRNVITNSRVRHNVESAFGEGSTGTNNVVRWNCISGAAGWYDDRDGSAVQHPAVGFSMSDNLIAQPRFKSAGPDDLRMSRSDPCNHLGERLRLRHARSGRRQGRLRITGSAPTRLDGRSQKLAVKVRAHGRWRTVGAARTHGRRFRIRVRGPRQLLRRGALVKVDAPGQAVSRAVRVHGRAPR